ncbi:cobalamin-dependent protein [Lichenicoccus sp.]|uniref:cobalamin B12-binding domain-containing protein n=1 Tax=Lichenicoccus sp. TaxID=2781899 RepID=UPI003D0EBC22
MGQPAPATREAVLRLIESAIVPRLADAYRDRQQRRVTGRRKGMPAARPVTDPASPEPHPVLPTVDGPVLTYPDAPGPDAPGPDAPGPDAPGANAPGPEAIAALAEDAMRLDDAAIGRHVEAALAFGLSTENILLDLLAPAARHLGGLWMEDRCTICDVTLGVMRLQARMQILLATLAPGAARPHRSERSIALWAVPGSTHRFGVAMLAEVFRLRGWHVAHGQIDDPFQIAAVLRARAYDVVGLSLGCGEQRHVLEECIRAARLTSRNREVIVMAGGPAFMAQEGLAGSLDVDAVADNAEDALLQAETLLDRRSMLPAPAARHLGSLAASPGVAGWSG